MEGVRTCNQATIIIPLPLSAKLALLDLSTNLVVVVYVLRSAFVLLHVRAGVESMDV